MRSEAQRRAVVKYDKNNIKRVVLKLNKKTDSDIIDYLDQQKNVNGTLKNIIREKIKG